MGATSRFSFLFFSFLPSLKVWSILYPQSMEEVELDRVESSYATNMQVSSY